jgi:adenylosuccinate lyase
LKARMDLIFSGQLLLDLVEHGVSREDAYRLVQGHAMRAWKEGLDFHQLVLADERITAKIPRKQIEHTFDLSRQLKNVDKIFLRVFGTPRKKGAKPRPRPSALGEVLSSPFNPMRRNKLRVFFP